MGTADVKEWLEKYPSLRSEYDTWCEQYDRLEVEQQIPAMRESDGSKRNPGASSRLESATIRKLEFERQTKAKIDDIQARMAAVESAIETLDDPLQRTIVTQRCVIGDEYYGLKPWKYIAMMLYGRCDEVGLKRVRRNYNAALAELARRETEKSEKSNL